MKIKQFAVSCPINIELDYFVHIKFSYGDGNYGDDMMPHQDEIIDIIDYKFEPAHLEETSTLDYDGLIALCYDYEHEWQSLEDYYETTLKKTTMEKTELENEVAYLQSLNRTYKSQIDDFMLKEQQDWFITLEFYVLAYRPIRDLVSDYKVNQYEHILALLREKLRTFDTPICDKDTGINRLRLKFVEYLKESIAECENYVKP